MTVAVISVPDHQAHVDLSEYREDHLIEGLTPAEAVINHLQSHQLPMLRFPPASSDIAEPEGDEREEFVQEMGLQESGLVRVARTVYQSLTCCRFSP